MPYKEFEIKKLYYSIGEVAEMFEVSASLIRFWEQEFDILQPKKNRKGNRLFTPEDVENFRLIYHLVKERGFTLEGARNKISQNHMQVKEQHDSIQSLLKIRSFLEALKDEL
jgi:DNA-binding transcriptional MerR regulator